MMRHPIVYLLLLLPLSGSRVTAQEVSSFTLPLALQSGTSGGRPDGEFYLLAGRTSTRLRLDGQAYRIRPRCSVIGGLLLLVPDPASGAGVLGQGARLRLGLEIGYSWDPRPREVTDRYNDLGLPIPLLDPRHLEHRIYHALLVVQARYPQYDLAWLVGLGGNVSRWSTDLWSDQDVSINDWALGPSWQVGLQWGHLRLRYFEQRLNAQWQEESITGSITRAVVRSRTRWFMIGLGF